MTKGVDQYVAENRQRIRQVDRRFIQVDSNQNRTLTFGPSTVDVDVGVELYTRPTGDQIITGHADAAHGFGRGTFGDDKGAWSLVTDATATAEFTKLGRKAVAESLNGDTGAVERAVAGVDTSSAATGDTALGNETARAPTFASAAGNQTTATAVFDAADWVGDGGEFGIEDADGRLLARVTVDPAGYAIASDAEVKGVVTLTFAGDGIGKSVVTSDGEAAIAESMASAKATVGPSEWAFGTGSTEFTKASSSLSAEVFRKPVARQAGRDRVTVSASVFEKDATTTPTLTGDHSYDLSEGGIVDNSGRLIWATTFRTTTKDDDTALDAEMSIVIS